MAKKKRWHCLPGQPLTELDKKVMYWENKGKEVPSRDLIKTPEQIEGIRRSGVVNTGVLDEVAKHIRAVRIFMERNPQYTDYEKVKTMILKAGSVKKAEQIIKNK